MSLQGLACPVRRECVVPVSRVWMLAPHTLLAPVPLADGNEWARRDRHWSPRPRWMWWFAWLFPLLKRANFRPITPCTAPPTDLRFCWSEERLRLWRPEDAGGAETGAAEPGYRSQKKKHVEVITSASIQHSRGYLTVLTDDEPHPQPAGDYGPRRPQPFYWPGPAVIVVGNGRSSRAISRGKHGEVPVIFGGPGSPGTPICSS